MKLGIVKNHPFTDGNKRTALLPVPHDAIWLASKILAMTHQ